METESQYPLHTAPERRVGFSALDEAPAGPGQFAAMLLFKHLDREAEEDAMRLLARDGMLVAA